MCVVWTVPPLYHGHAAQQQHKRMATPTTTAKKEMMEPIGPQMLNIKHYHKHVRFKEDMRQQTYL